MHIMRDYRVTYKSVPLMCDSSSAICLAQNLVFHWRGKHIKVIYHFLRDHVEKGDIVIKYIDTKRQLTDIFTKPFDATHFASLRGRGTWCLPSLWLGLRGSLYFALYILYPVSFCCSVSFPSYSPKLILLHLLY
jgi:hypothetical protein